MELHIVLFKKAYGTQENAMKHSDGLTVLAFFFIISQTPNPSYIEISQSLKRIIKAPKSTMLEYPLALGDYIHDDLNEFFVYDGSLTTPPCLDKYFITKISSSEDHIINTALIYLRLAFMHVHFFMFSNLIIFII